jgi:hypothetical protein
MMRLAPVRSAANAMISACVSARCGMSPSHVVEEDGHVSCADVVDEPELRGEGVAGARRRTEEDLVRAEPYAEADVPMALQWAAKACIGRRRRIGVRLLPAAAEEGSAFGA